MTKIKKIVKLDFINIRNIYYVSKGAIKKVKRQPTKWNKIFANHKYCRLVSRLYKEL